MEIGQVTSSPTIMMGKAVIAGTRITVELILEKLAAGESPEQILAAYPQLNSDSLRAAYDFAQSVAGRCRLPHARAKSMNLLADESVERPIVLRLQADGHQVMSIAETQAGMSDDVVLDAANASSSLLLTEDKDFGELVFRLGRIHQGVVLIRLAGLSANSKCDLVSQAFSTGEQMLDAFPDLGCWPQNSLEALAHSLLNRRRLRRINTRRSSPAVGRSCGD